MQIVVIAHFAGSLKHGMVFGHYYLAREWVRMGHEVTIVAAAYAHTRSSQPEGISGTFTEERIDGIRLIVETVRTHVKPLPAAPKAKAKAVATSAAPK